MRALPVLLLSIAACDGEPERPPLGERSSDAAQDAAGAGDAAPMSPIPDAAAPPPSTPLPFVALLDESQGLGVGLGVDVDAVEALCEGETRHAVDSGQAAAVGAPDGTSVHLEPNGVLVLDFQRDLRGCTLTVHETDHLDGEVVAIHACPAAVLDAECDRLGTGLTAVVR